MTTLANDFPNGPSYLAQHLEAQLLIKDAVDPNLARRSYGAPKPFGPGTKYPNLGVPRPPTPIVGKTSNGDHLHHAVSVGANGTAKPFVNTDHFGPSDHHEAIYAYTKAAAKTGDPQEAQKHYAMIAHHAQALIGMTGEMHQGRQEQKALLASSAPQTPKMPQAVKPPATPKPPKVG